MVFHPHEDAADVLEFYREFTADAPREVACYALVVHVPPEAPFPEESHGDTAIALVACHSGDVEDAEGDLAPLGAFGDPILSAIQPMPYMVLQQSFDDGAPDGERYYFKAHYLDELTDGAIETIIDHTDPLPGPFSMIGLEPIGGAINEVDADATAFPHRDAAYSFGVWAGWSDSARDEELIDWTREIHVAMTEYANGGVYSNYLDSDESDRLQAAYRDNYDRLVALKQEWDPENVSGTQLDPSP